MHDFYEEDESTIEEYRKKKIQICKELHHWKYLTIEEQIKFKHSTNINEIERFMITSRQRSYDASYKLS